MHRRLRNVDDELLDELLRMKPTRVLLDKSNPIEELTDTQFFQRFRFSKPAFRYLVDFVDSYQFPRISSSSLTNAQKLFIFCRVLAQNNFQLTAGELFGVSKSTVSCVIDSLSSFFTGKAGEFIHWPSQEDQRLISGRYFARTNIPDLVGCIDGSHIRILRPVDQEDQFINRKGYHSINIGAVCDDRRRFLWLSTHFPGRTHDSKVFKESQLYRDLQTGSKTGVIVGDSAYALESFLMKPILKNNRSEKEVRFTNALCRARVDIEHAFGVLKRQWHILHSEVRYSPEKASRIITSCICLRNFSIQCREQEFDGPEDDFDDDQPDADSFTDMSGSERQDAILERFF